MLAARSRSASERTISGSLPPSSSETGVRVCDARAMTSARRRRAGEHDHVDVVHEHRARLAPAGRDLEDVLRESAVAQRVGEQERRERRDLGGLEDHAVARCEGWDAVAEGVRERVVPRPDDADQPERPVAEDELLALDEDGARLDGLVGEVVGGVLGPEPERVGAVRDLRELSVLVGLPRLGHDRVDRAVRVVEQPLLGAEEDLGAPLEAAASQAGWAARPCAARRSTSAAVMSGTVATISPVAGFSTGIPPSTAAPFPATSTCSCTLAICSPPARSCAPKATPAAPLRLAAATPRARPTRCGCPGAADRRRRCPSPRSCPRRPCRRSPGRRRCASRPATAPRPS